MKRVKRIIGTLCILFPVFLFLICGVMLIGISDDGEDGDPAHASGLGLSDKVRGICSLCQGIRQRNTIYMSMKKVSACHHDG